LTFDVDPMRTVLRFPLFVLLAVSSAMATDIRWLRRSTTTGDLAVPNQGSQQTCNVVADFDGDGKLDLVGGGRWFKHQGGRRFKAMIIDDAMRFTQCAAGQLVKGGWAEVVFSPGDRDGTAKWYERRGGEWVAHDLRHVIHGHSCEIRDLDGDKHLDIMIGEMGEPGAGNNAQTFVWFGDGRGHFRETVASRGQGIHEGQIADLNGDGRLDILMKPYHHNAPRIDVLLNMSR